MKPSKNIGFYVALGGASAVLVTALSVATLLLVAYELYLHAMASHA